MILSDTIIENNALFLKNIDKNSSTSFQTGSVGSYGIYRIVYSEPLIKDHVYYIRAVYKFTTTNQSPTWVQIYYQGGYSSIATSKHSNPAANTEITISGFGIPVSGPIYSMSEGMIYNGNSNAISGVSGHIKNSVVYDVTKLKHVLYSCGTVSNDTEFKNWCDKNLAYSAPGEYLDITSLIPSNTKVSINDGLMMSNIVECDGMLAYSVSAGLRNNTYFDSASGLSVYNNKSNGTVTHTIISADGHNSPFWPEHKYILKIQTNGEASPGTGGFVATHIAGANKIFIERFVAKIPVGYNVTSAYNAQGTGASVTYLSDRAGTGEWKEYAILYKCGSSGSFSSGGHVYLTASSGYSAQAVTWYIAYVNNCEITSNPELQSYTAMPCTDRIKGACAFSYKFDTVNIFPNGDGSDTGMELPAGWTFDTEDVAGNAKASFVQPVGAAQGRYLGGEMVVNPHHRYKVSMWVKCKRDMTSYLSAIFPYVGSTQLSHPLVVYVKGTKTTLTADLVSGATQMSVKSNANWVDTAYGSAGFRSNVYTAAYNDRGNSHASVTAGQIQGVSGSDKVLFKTAYSGATIPSGTVVVECKDGSKFPYPTNKNMLPTDNTWKYIEGYFGGDNVTWDGESANNNWEALPSQTTCIKFALNIYTNDGTVPIKYSDIRIEEVGRYDGERHEKKIQIKRFK